MRKTTIALLALGLAVAFAATASATVFYTETFTFPDQPLGATPAGTVNATTGWMTHSGTAGGGPFDIQIIGNEMVANMANAPDDSRPFGPGFSVLTGAADKTYSCMKFYMPPQAVAISPTPTYFAHFKDNLPTGTTFSAKLFVQGIDASTFNIGISNGAVNSPVYWGAPLVTGHWYVVATRFDAATGTGTLWVDPADETSTSVSGTDATPTGRVLGAYGFRQSTANWMFKIDDLSVGTTFAETCGGYPTPASRSTWGRIKTIYR